MSNVAAHRKVYHLDSDSTPNRYNRHRKAWCLHQSRGTGLRPVPNPLAGCLLKEAFLFHLLRLGVEWRVGPRGPTHVFLFFSRFLGWLASHAEPSAVFFVAVETPVAGIRLTSIQVGIGPKSRSTFVSEPSAVFGARIQGLGGRDRSRRLWFKANPFHYVNKSLG